MPLPWLEQLGTNSDPEKPLLENIEGEWSTKREFPESWKIVSTTLVHCINIINDLSQAVQMPTAATGTLGSLQAVQAAHINQTAQPLPQQPTHLATAAGSSQRDFLAGNSNSSANMLALQQLLAVHAQQQQQQQQQQTGGGLPPTNGAAGIVGLKVWKVSNILKCFLNEMNQHYYLNVSHYLM